MNLMTRWGVALKSTVVPAKNANRRDSAWPTKAYTVFRKFDSRADARAYKTSPPKSYAGKAMYIIDLNSGHVVR